MGPRFRVLPIEHDVPWPELGIWDTVNGVFVARNLFDRSRAQKVADAINEVADFVDAAFDDTAKPDNA